MVLQKQKKIYCFDTSAFVALSRTSENIIKLPGALWGHLETMMQSSEIISHRVVFDEISSNTKNPDFITKWIADKKHCFLTETDVQIAEIPKIIQKFPTLIDYKCEREQADHWLIALAIEKSKEHNLFDIYESAVVSQEKSNSSKKIPAVCKAFGVRHLSLKSFFSEIGLSARILKKKE